MSGVLVTRRQLRNWERCTRSWIEKRGDPVLLMLFEANLRREWKLLRLYELTRFCSFATGALFVGYVGLVVEHLLFVR
jgi:hypothetical protein